MAGLLDDFKMPGMDTPQGQGLLAAAFNLMSAKGPSLSNALGQAGGQYMGVYNQAKTLAQQQAEAAQMQKYRQAQIDEFTQKTAREKAAMEQQANQRQIMSRLFTPASQGAPALNVDSMMPPEMRTGLPSQPAMQPRAAGIDPAMLRQALAAGVSPKDLMEADGLRNLGLDEVARTVEGTGPDGRPVTYSKDKFNRDVGAALPKWVEDKQADLGGSVAFLDPFTHQPRASLPKSMTPDSRASNAFAWANNAATLRGQDMTDLRTRDANEIKRTEVTSAKDQAKAGQVASFDVMLGTLGRLADHPGLSRSVGAIGAFPTMPGSESANFKAELNTFQSQAFIPMVSQLKGMGALSDAEGKKLTAAVGALDPAMGENAFRESIARITSEMEAARARVSGQPIPQRAAGETGQWGIQKVN